jgi:hypothetical protein
MFCFGSRKVHEEQFGSDYPYSRTKEGSNGDDRY